MASLAIAILGFLVWAHHMFVAGISIYGGLVFSMLSFLVAIPSGIKVFNWTATLYKGSIQLDTPMLYALGFIGLFTIGGLTGLFLATLGIDMHVHDTYFVIAHFHYIMVGGAVMAYMGGLHFWWPKITGKLYPEMWGRIAAVILFCRIQPDVFPAIPVGLPWHAAAVLRVCTGIPGLQRDVDGWRSILAIGYLLPLGYLLWSLRRGKTAGPNPFHAAGLEWTIASPPPPDNFDETPVAGEPYNYHEMDFSDV